jgi:hypothetical protein
MSRIFAMLYAPIMLSLDCSPLRGSHDGLMVRQHGLQRKLQSMLPYHQSMLPYHQSMLPYHQSVLPYHQSMLPYHQSIKQIMLVCVLALSDHQRIVA